MKKINSNGYGSKMVFAIVLFLVILPLLGHILHMLAGGEWVLSLIRVSMSIGVCIMVLMILLLVVELHQDKQQYQSYQAHRNRKVPLSDGHQECQACGNRALHAEDTQCGVCGCHFEE